MPFGQALAVWAKDGGQVCELRDRPAECLIDSYLFGGVGDVIVAADDVSDAHESVIDGDDVVINRDAGRDATGTADQHRVADCVCCKLYWPANNIVEAEGMVFYFQADGELLAFGEVALDRGSVEGAAAPGVDLRAVCGSGQGALGFELFRSAKATVGFAFSKKTLSVLGID